MFVGMRTKRKKTPQSEQKKAILAAKNTNISCSRCFLKIFGRGYGQQSCRRRKQGGGSAFVRSSPVRIQPGPEGGTQQEQKEEEKEIPKEEEEEETEEEEVRP